MSVELIWITPKAEENMMYCARVSNPNNQNSNNPKLLSYCIKHKHWSIFEMASMCVEISTSRAIGRQILRHRSFSFQEFSQRYADVSQLTKDMIVNEARTQDYKNRQASHTTEDQELKDWFDNAQQEVWNKATDLYQQALDKGIAKEQARVILPEGLTSSRMYMTGSIRSWIHYLDLRTGNGTQKEHADIARQVQEIFKQQLPTVAEALEW